jgi:type VI secretion system protein ImpL
LLPPVLQSLVLRISTGADTTVGSEADRLKSESERAKTDIDALARKAEIARLAGIESSFRQQVLPECNRIVAGRYPFTKGSDNDVPLLDFAKLFGDNGVFDSFFRTHLTPLVDTSRRPWRWQPGLAAEQLSQEMLHVFQDATDVREAFFQGGAQLPGMQFTAMLIDFDQSAATRFRLDIEGAVIDSQAPRQMYKITWPGPKASLVRATFDGRYSTPYSESFHGPWAWFKLLERSKMDRESDIRNVLTISIKGIQAALAIEALTVRNPFASAEWQRFRCGS